LNREGLTNYPLSYNEFVPLYHEGMLGITLTEYE